MKRAKTSFKRFYQSVDANVESTKRFKRDREEMVVRQKVTGVGAALQRLEIPSKSFDFLSSSPIRLGAGEPHQSKSLKSPLRLSSGSPPPSCGSLKSF